MDSLDHRHSGTYRAENAYQNDNEIQRLVLSTSPLSPFPLKSATNKNGKEREESIKERKVKVGILQTNRQIAHQ